jgi:hypothetical protein
MPTEDINNPVAEITPAEPTLEPPLEPAPVEPINPPSPLYQGGGISEPPAAASAEAVNATSTSPQPSPYQGEGKRQNPPSPLPARTTVQSGGYQGGIATLLQKAKEKIQFRKRAKLEKIMALTQSRGKITNDDAQKLLRFSDATATRYLAELVKQGRLRRVGPAKRPYYEI